MKPMLYGCGTAAGLAFCLLAGIGTAPSQGDKKYPIVEKCKHESYAEKLTDQVKFEMIAIPGGTFLMGSPENEKGRKEGEGPLHLVTIKPFWMGKCEVTWNEYDLYWVKKPGKQPSPKTDNDKAADAVTRPTPPYADETFGHPDARAGGPVLCITHHAAMKYCEWLSAKTGKYYRLPTEAEWEWACRAGATTAFSFGDDPGKIEDYAWCDKNSEDVAHKVRQKKANPWGLHDMHGNLSEWCLDHYLKDGYKKFDLGKPFLQPVELPTDARYSYVVRGGSWADPPAMLRSAARRGSNKDWLRRDPQRPQSIWWMTDADFVGFRVVRAVEEQANLKALHSKMTRESPDN